MKTTQDALYLPRRKKRNSPGYNSRITGFSSETIRAKGNFKRSSHLRNLGQLVEGTFDHLYIKGSSKFYASPSNIQRVLSRERIVSKVLDVSATHIIARCEIDDNHFEIRQFDITPIKHLNLDRNDEMVIEVVTFNGGRTYHYSKTVGAINVDNENEGLNIEEWNNLAFFNPTSIDDEDQIF